MSTLTIERTGDWDSVPFAGGFAGLRDLADDDFSGMVTTGPTRLFMLRGAVVGVLDGDIDDFADGGGTAREAPHPALPLLAVMQERSDEVRAKYYTEETPMSEVDRTLSDGNFTGYIELAENILSGDYYQVYHQGRSMSVAYVGASERLITDDEAFDQADDEVGIYEVRPVDVEIIDIPEPEDDGGTDGTTAAAAGGADTGVDTGTDATDDIGSSEATTDDEDSVDADAATQDETVPAEDTAAATGGTGVTTESESATSAASAAEAVDSDGATSADEGAVPDAEPDEAIGVEPTSSDSTTTSSTDESELGEATTGDASSETAPDAGGDGSGSADGAGTSTSTGGSTRPADSGTSESTTAESSPAESSTGSSSTSESSTTASSPASGGAADAAAGQSGGAGAGQAGPTQQGQPAPDHPAARGRGQRGGSSAGNGSAGADQTEESIGAGDLEVRSLPSLDPSRTASASRQERERRSASASGGATTSNDAQRSEPSQSTGSSQQGSTGAAGAGGSTQGSEPAGQAGQAASGAAAGGGSAGANGEPATAEQTASQSADAAQSKPETSEPETGGSGGASSEELEEARAEAQRLESELSELQGEHEAVVEERDRLEAELAEAREEIDRLRGRLEDAADQGTEASQKLSPRQAIDETNLFIRYDSKGEATLEKAHSGEVDKAAVDANMRLEYHTSFDANDAAVDGVDFDSFLTDTVQYRFVDWLVRKLLYEIRDTGNTGPMGELYDALPQVDRAELNGQVGVQYTENGEEHRAQVGFDVIVRDRMGNPLIVANLNDSRDPATDSMMTDLVRAAERVGESSPSLAGAFLVTRSFFEPEALETAEEATAGGLLNRSKQKSFVNLSRKGGYHLCLVEARNQEFHLAVPEL